MRTRLFALMFLSSLAFGSTAGIYKWTDENGKVHFGDRPPGAAKAEQVELKINTYTSPEIIPHSSGSIEQGRVVTGKKRRVVMYSTEWCGVCKKAKRYFQAKKIPFKEYDVEKSSKGKRDFKKLKGRGVPVILVGKSRMNGFSVARFNKLYESM